MLVPASVLTKTVDTKECGSGGYRRRPVISDEEPQAADTFNLRGIKLHRAEIPSIRRLGAARAICGTYASCKMRVVNLLRQFWC